MVLRSFNAASEREREGYTIKSIDRKKLGYPLCERLSTKNDIVSGRGTSVLPSLFSSANIVAASWLHTRRNYRGPSRTCSSFTNELYSVLRSTYPNLAYNKESGRGSTHRLGILSQQWLWHVTGHIHLDESDKYQACPITNQLVGRAPGKVSWLVLGG